MNVRERIQKILNTTLAYGVCMDCPAYNNFCEENYCAAYRELKWLFESLEELLEELRHEE